VKYCDERLTVQPMPGRPVPYGESRLVVSQLAQVLGTGPLRRQLAPGPEQPEASDAEAHETITKPLDPKDVLRAVINAVGLTG